MMATAGAMALYAIAGCSAAPGTPGAVADARLRPAATHVADTSPSPTPTPIQLVTGELVGTPTWPEGDTTTGGQGQYMAGFNCLKSLSEPNHHHVHLSIFVNGQQLAVPMGVGMFQPGKGGSGYIYHQTCLYWLHTHDQTGVLHMESAQPPTAQLFNLGNFFKLWGEPFSNTQLAQFNGTVAVYLNGMLDTTDTDVRKVALTPGDDITLVIGTPPIWMPAYLLPAGLSP
jgi:hypothetical protein